MHRDIVMMLYKHIQQKKTGENIVHTYPGHYSRRFFFLFAVALQLARAHLADCIFQGPVLELQ